MDKYIGKKLDGRYEIRELIGVGGMANVYKAYDVLENRVVAVKILREEYMNNDEFMRRFRTKNGVLDCASLLRAAKERGEVRKEHCDRMVFDAVEILEDLMK